MATLSGGLPDARIAVGSVPDIYHFWSILKDNGSARSTWSAFGICQSMLANPLSTDQADVDRRASVSQRNIDFNTQLAEVCAQYIHCRFDNNAGFNAAFMPADVSTLERGTKRVARKSDNPAMLSLTLRLAPWQTHQPLS